MSPIVRRSIRLALASLIAVALIAQLAIGMSRNDLSVANFFSFFTVLSNTAAVLMLAMIAIRPGRDIRPDFALFRGAVTVYMSVTGLVYAVILAPNVVDVGLTEPWVDVTLHVIGPLAVAADWLTSPPPRRLALRSLAIWLVFPALYLGYTLVRGPMVDWYPYPILDPRDEGGYPVVAMWSGIVLIVILSLSWSYRWWANRSHAKPPPV